MLNINDRVDFLLDKISGTVVNIKQKCSDPDWVDCFGDVPVITILWDDGDRSKQPESHLKLSKS